jgi:hypothetical protein
MLVDQVPDVVAYVTRIESRGDIALVTTHQHGTAVAGGAATWDFHTVVAIDPDTGLIARHEYFDTDRWEEAMACFDRSGVRTPE